MQPDTTIAARPAAIAWPKSGRVRLRKIDARAGPVEWFTFCSWDDVYRWNELRRRNKRVPDGGTAAPAMEA